MSDQTKRFSKDRSKALWLMALTLAVALIFAGSAMTQTQQTKTATGTQAAAPPAKTQQPAGAKTPAKPKTAAGTTITVTITPVSPTNPKLKVTPDSVGVGRNDEVEWKCSTACDFNVSFNEVARKPFNDRAFNRNRPRSGHPTGAPGTYKYTVIVGGDIIDPDVIIR